MALIPGNADQLASALAAIDNALKEINAAIAAADVEWAAAQPGADRDRLADEVDTLMEHRDGIRQARGLVRADFTGLAAAIEGLNAIAAENERISVNIPEATTWIDRLTGWTGQTIKIAKIVNTTTHA